MNIVYGGAFNPPTIAHLNIIRKLTDLFQDAKVIILPVGDQYQKDDLVLFHHRYEMLKKMTSSMKNVIISTLEQEHGFIGTVHSLKILSKTYAHIHFVIGSDHLNQLKTWIDYQTLLKAYPLIVINRNHYMKIEQAEQLFKDIKHQFIFIDFNMEISSTKVRNQIHKNKHLLDGKVYQYIQKHQLYKD